MRNLAECAEPLFDLSSASQKRAGAASEHMAAEGCDHHNTIWGDTAPQDLYIPALMVMGGAWLALHMYRYEYNPPTLTLRRAYPAEERCRFFVDFIDILAFWLPARRCRPKTPTYPSAGPASGEPRWTP